MQAAVGGLADTPLNGEPAGDATSAAFGHGVGGCVALGWFRGDAVEELMNGGKLEVALPLAGECRRGTASLEPPL